LFLAIGSIVGALGAFLLARVGLTPAGWSVLAILLGAVLGGCFALMTRSRATTPGAGLIWALAFSFLLWLAGPAVANGALGRGRRPTMASHDIREILVATDFSPAATARRRPNC
jgi:hypothetical protein